MYRKAFWFFRSVFVLSVMLVLGLGCVQAQITGFIPVFVDEFGTEDVSVLFQTPTGNIGIGTTIPASILHINKSTSDYILFDSRTNGNWGLKLRGDSDGPTDVATFIANGSSGEIRIGSAFSSYFPTFYAGNAEAMRITTSGNIGIGTTTPASKLHVAGRVLATGYDMPSDIRLKEDITPLTGVLEKLDKIRVVSFKWNARSEGLGHSKGHPDVGVIAQEVEAVFPDLVATGDKGNYKAVDYSRLTTVVIEAVKELKAENGKLKRRIEMLENK